MPTQRTTLRLHRRPQVALLIETSLEPGRGILRGISQFVREHEPWSILHEPRGLESSPPAWLARWRGDGIIARLSHERIAAAVLNTGIPAVDTLGMVRKPELPLVHSDDAAIGRLGAEHLLERGFRHFGCCGVRTVWSEETCQAFLATVRAAGGDGSFHELPPYNRSRPSWDIGQKRLAEWVRRLPQPAGVLACSDPRAQRVLDACRLVGIGVPDEVAVLGVGNDETICDLCNPPLSSVLAGHERVGYEAARMLDRLMRGEQLPSQRLSLEPLGVVTRQSTDLVAVNDADIITAVRYIREYACDGISVEDVAQQCALSRTELKRRFRHFLGRSVHDQIIRERIKRAEELLLRTTLSISQIARKTGFGDQTYLGVVFRNKVGKTPGQYRKQIRQ